MKTLTTRYGRKIPFDTQRWSLRTDNYTCQIIGERENDYLLLDANALVTWVPKATIRDNAYEIVGDEVTLSAGVYAKWITLPRVYHSQDRLQELFMVHRELLFRNRERVLSRGEYYFLSPEFLRSGGAYIGGFRYTLGALLEAMEEKVPGVYFEEFAGHRDLYLVCLSGSPLSGMHHSLFWSDEQQQFIRIDSSQSRLPGGFLAAFRGFKDALNPGSGGLSFPGEALEQLLGELGVEV
jgi:hypothetical protein